MILIMRIYYNSEKKIILLDEKDNALTGITYK